MQYDFATYTPEQGWKMVRSGKMNVTDARKVFTHLTEQGFSVRAFRGARIGRIVGAYYRPEHLPELSKVQTPANLEPIEFRLMS